MKYVAEGAILENVPATIVAPVPGPPDFNGASAVIARLPNIGFAPSMLTEKGFETRGSFTVRKSRAGESFYLRVYGKLNHNIRCTLRGYRNLMGDFTGNTIYTGYHIFYDMSVIFLMIHVSSVMDLHVVGWLFNIVHVAMCITGRFKRQSQGIVSGQHFLRQHLYILYVTVTVGQTTRQAWSAEVHRMY